MENNPDKREKLAREIAKIVGVTSLVLSLVATVSFINSSSNSLSSELSSFEDLLDSDEFNANSWDDSWVPSGFTAWKDDSNISWKWAAKNNCQDYGCLSVEFISLNGCPSGLYAELNWYDNDDVIVSYSNENLPSLLPMQKVKLRFDDYEDAGETGRMSTIRCN